MKRIVGAGALVMAVCLAIACKDDQDKGPSKEQLDKQADIQKAEDDLLERRDMLLNTRLELQGKRAELVEKRATIAAEGGDTSAIDQEAQQLLDQEKNLVSQEQELNQQLDSLLQDRRAMVSAITAGAGNVAGREAAVASREKELAAREARIAQRESALAEREEQLASKWKDSCAVGATTTIVQTVDAQGTTYTKRDVEPLLARARREMNKKGLVGSDLPSPVRELESEATKAMAKADYGKAHFAANQLLANIRAIRIDKAFIAAKIGRLNQLIKGKRLSESVENLFRGATEDVADGKFSAANRKLNKIYAEID